MAIPIRSASDRVLFLNDVEGTLLGSIDAVCQLSAFLSDHAAHKELQDASADLSLKSGRRLD